MSDDQTTSELVGRLVRAQKAEQKAYLRFFSPANKRVVDYLGDAISAIEALQARVVALESEIARRDEARPHIEYVRRSLDHYAPSVEKMKARLDQALQTT